MKSQIEKFEKALMLRRHVVGIKFLTYKAEYDAYEAKELTTAPTTVCGVVRMAMEDTVIKITGENLRCLGGAQSLGLVEEDAASIEGRVYNACGLYKSHAIARQVISSMNHIGHRIYGAVMGTLSLMDDADTVIILGNAKQMMRVMQGYTYEYGIAKNITTAGNQAMCSDLISKPFKNNDLNLSLMCCGARMMGQCDDSELGIGLPIQMFLPVAKGVLKTLNLTESNRDKKKLIESLSTPDELGFTIENDLSYGTNAGVYREYIKVHE